MMDYSKITFTTVLGMDSFRGEWHIIQATDEGLGPRWNRGGQWMPVRLLRRQTRKGLGGKNQGSDPTGGAVCWGTARGLG